MRTNNIVRLLFILLLVAVLVLGCVPKKGGGFSCVILPHSKSKSATESTQVSPPTTGTEGAATPESAGTGAPGEGSVPDFEADFTSPPPQ